jgi:hypothetical protein
MMNRANLRIVGAMNGSWGRFVLMPASTRNR